MVEILQPLIDSGVPLTTFSVHLCGYIKRGLDHQNVRATSMADFVDPCRPMPCASYNGMRRLVGKIMRREGLGAPQAPR
ncbi:hypothetical protein [Duganella vulcania]|uniref:Uncharacterized protein n=1 Tax=Duganella vulcania TaxID=2692166 RepID=A0A845GGY2_9BURK|nr:hypothetical protein [Duganella vulcania]MYM92682.1 hypothetical protein [Duganella vulcania]